MSALSKAFASDKAFIPFLTLGFPDLETTKQNILAAQKAGANVIELEFPFQIQRLKAQSFNRPV